MSSSRQHLHQVEESYFEHGSFAIRWGVFLVLTGIASIIHGIIPGLFPFTAPRNILFLKRLMDERDEQGRMTRAENQGEPSQPSD